MRRSISSICNVAVLKNEATSAARLPGACPAPVTAADDAGGGKDGGKDGIGNLLFGNRHGRKKRTGADGADACACMTRAGSRGATIR